MFCLSEIHKGFVYLILGAVLILNYLDIIRGVDLFAGIALLGYGFYKVGGISWFMNLFKKKEDK